MSEYYAKLLDDARSIQIGTGPGEWYQLWHTHVDWEGVGNRSPEDRRRHLEALFIVFDRVRKQANSLRSPHQAWALVHESDSSEDAVYLHTPNPNADDFPYEFEGVSWGVPQPALLRGVVDAARFEFGRSEFEGRVQHWVRSMAAAR